MIDYLERGHTATGDYYAQELKQLCETIKKNRRVWPLPAATKAASSLSATVARSHGSATNWLQAPTVVGQRPSTGYTQQPDIGFCCWRHNALEQCTSRFKKLFELMQNSNVCSWI